MNTDENLQKAWSILDNLKPAEIMELKRIPEDRREVFISCAKQYIDCFKTIEFNADYTKIRKLSDFCNFDFKIS